MKHTPKQTTDLTGIMIKKIPTVMENMSLKDTTTRRAANIKKSISICKSRYRNSTVRVNRLVTELEQ